MRICFFGHADYNYPLETKEALTHILRDYVDRFDCEFLFGGYGRFDDLAYRCVKELCSPNRIRAVFVTPYITESYLKNQLEYHKNKYDEVIYPEIENVSLKFAISARNKWMVEQSDVVITYVNQGFGGAYSALKYAKSKRKFVINLGTL